MNIVMSHFIFAKKYSGGGGGGDIPISSEVNTMRRIGERLGLMYKVSREGIELDSGLVQCLLRYRDLAVGQINRYHSSMATTRKTTRTTEIMLNTMDRLLFFLLLWSDCAELCFSVSLALWTCSVCEEAVGVPSELDRGFIVDTAMVNRA